MFRVPLAKMFAIVLALPLALPATARASGKTAAIREAVEWLAGKFGSRVTREGAEALAPRLERLALKHGDEVLPVVRRLGPEAVEALEQAGQHGGEVLKLLVRRGDDALWITAKPGRLALFLRYGGDAEEALIKHRALAAELIEAMGAPAGRAMTQLSGRQARRLVEMSRSGDLARIGRTDELLDLVRRFGDRGSDFLWRNKLPLATGTALAAFLADPQPFIGGTRDLATAAVEHIVRPITAAGGQVAVEAARRTNWTLLALVGLLALAAPSVWRRGHCQGRNQTARARLRLSRRCGWPARSRRRGDGRSG